jgi:peptide/nickel transport system permease protein
MTSGSDAGSPPPDGRDTVSFVGGPAESVALASQTVPRSGQISESGRALLDDDITVLSQRRFRSLRDLLRRPKFMVGGVLFGVIVILAIFAPLVTHYGPNIPDYSAINQAPSGAHILGTDYLGRDMWSRLVYGGRVSLPAGCFIVLISFLIGVPWGIVAGYGSRIVDDILMRFIDVLLALPGLVLALSIVAILGPSIKSVIIALGIAGIPGYARIARASTLSARELDFVMASRAQGGGAIHIMRIHILRTIVDPLVILATLNLSGAILAAAALSFLGVGTQIPAADWGTMLSSGYNYMFESAGQVLFPAIIIVITVLGINLLGDALGEALNPRLQRR